MGQTEGARAKLVETVTADTEVRDSTDDEKKNRWLRLREAFVRPSCRDELASLERQLQSIISRPASKPNLHNTTRKLHVAAKYNDVKTIDFYIDLGCELDIEDPSGDTPLLIAAVNGSLEAAKILRSAQVDAILVELLGSDATTNIMYHYHKEKVEIAHTNRLVRKLMEKRFDSKGIGKVLAGIDCKLDEVVAFHDPMMTKTYLKSCDVEVENRENPVIFRDDMYKLSLKHIEVLITCGSGWRDRKDFFSHALLQNFCDYEKFREGRDFLRALSTWQILDDEFLEIFENWMHWCPKRVVKVILKYGFHAVAEAKYARDVTRNIFGNLSVTVRNERIDVDKRYHRGETPLHIAAKYSADNNVRLLLGRGADPNVMNDEGDTPLSLVFKSKSIGRRYFERCVKLLLFSGAVPMTVSDRFEGTFFHFDRVSGDPSDYSGAYKFLVAHLAIYEAAGMSIERSIENLRDRELTRLLEECREQLKEFKTHEIRGTQSNEDRETCKLRFTIVRILAERPDKIVRCISDEDLRMIPKLMTAYSRKTVNSYYRELLKQRVKDIIRINRYRNRAIRAVCQFTGIDDPNQLVVNKIVNYFTLKDLVIFKDEHEKLR